MDSEEKLVEDQQLYDPHIGGQGATLPSYQALYDMIHMVVSALASKPDQIDIQVTELQEPNFITFNLRVAPEDKGRVIGRNGRVAEALRAILKAAAVKMQNRIVLEIN